MRYISDSLRITGHSEIITSDTSLGILRAGGVIYHNITPANSVGGGSGNTLMIGWIPANTLHTNGMSLWVQGFGRTTNGTGTKTVLVYYGGTLLTQFSPVASVVQYWLIEGRGYRTSGTNVKWWIRVMNYNTSTGATTTILNHINVTAAQTSNQNFAVTATTTGAANQVVMESLLIGIDDFSA